MTKITDGPLFERLFPPALKPCCQRVVDTYLTLFDPPRLRAALFCPTCGARWVCTSIIHDEVTWTEETP